MEEVLSLRRDKHAQFTKETFSSLLKSGDFADVTLVDEDNIQSTAHKVILSAGSGFFRELFSSNPHPHPLVYLRIPNSHMLALLNFIYDGNCIVPETEMKEFMEIANDLGIMPEEGEGEVIIVKKSKEKVNVTVEVDQIKKSDDTADQHILQTKTNHDGVQKIKEEINIDDAKTVKKEDKYVVEADDAANLCKMCGKRFSRNRDLRRHIVYKHDGVNNDKCPNCKKVLSGKSELNRHMIDIHSERTKEICDICNKEFSRKRDVIEHKRFKHSEDQKDKCDKCKKIFENKRCMKTHKKFIHKENILSCDQCPFKTQHKPSMNHHVKSIHQGV